MTGSQPQKPPPGVVTTRPLSEWGSGSELPGGDSARVHLFLRFIQATSRVQQNEAALLTLIAEYAFRAFPQSARVGIAVRPAGDSELQILLDRSRAGGPSHWSPAGPVIDRVLREATVVAYQPPASDASPETERNAAPMSLLAPLARTRRPYGLLEIQSETDTLDYSRDDLDIFGLFATHVGLLLDHVQLQRQQTRAFESTINALVHSLTLKDPETAFHSERVQSIALLIGRVMGLSSDDMAVLGVAALLHDLGKQGVRDDVLHKPGRLTDDERGEMDVHARHTQNILDRIEYPEHLRRVPLVAAYHHEKMNGTGPYQIPGEQIPMESRIISVSDVVDALSSPRAYKAAMPPLQTLAILERGRGVEWDTRVIDALLRVWPVLRCRIYGDLDAATFGDEAAPERRAA